MASEKVKSKQASGTVKQIEFLVRAESAKQVLVTGDFTGWSEEGIRLKRDANGEWKAVLKFLPGEYQYRIRVDGRWEDHAEATKRVQNPFGGENCVLTVA